MFNILFGLCALYQLPGPNVTRFQNGSWQLYTPNRRLCPRFDPYRDTIFELYTIYNPTKPNILLTGDVSSVVTSNIDFNRFTIMFFHGFLENPANKDAFDIRRRFLFNGNYNIIIVNNERILAGPDYLTAAGNCLPIAKYSAKFIDFLVQMGLRLERLYIVGMSLGGQIAGLTGKHIRSGRAHRITALDPAGPLFTGLPQTQRIGPDDAEFVDIIHTSVFGIPLSSGKVDIWVNGATFQPGCVPPAVTNKFPGSFSELIFCSHYQAVRMYLMSLVNITAYPVTKCKDYQTFQKGVCNNNEQTYLGVGTSLSARGNFYIKIGATALDI